jgi:hypothetical protein
MVIIANTHQLAAMNAVTDTGAMAAAAIGAWLPYTVHPLS